MKDDEVKLCDHMMHTESTFCILISVFMWNLLAVFDDIRHCKAAGSSKILRAHFLTLNMIFSP